MKLTLIHPCIGRRIGQDYIKTWQMEPLPLALIAGLTPSEVEIAFYDDRIEPIPFDEPTDLVAISIETYTAKRAYQIASEFRSRNVPVVMGGFHASLCPEEVSMYADTVVVGEADLVWTDVLADAGRGALSTYYASPRPSLNGSRPDRSIFAGKRYLPLSLVESSRGCRFGCDFCAIQSAYCRTQTWRPINEVVHEVAALRTKSLIFFIDDNIGGDIERAKDLFRALAPLGIRWVGQISINAAFDEECLALMKASGCQGVLIGFESLDPANLRMMNKQFNTMRGGYQAAIANLRRHSIRLYITFVFGYDADSEDSFDASVRFAIKHRFYIAAFNHLTPFPRTPLYERLQREGRLLYDPWWLDDRYGYNMIPFKPANMSPERLQQGCVNARADFYRWSSIFRRGSDPVNRENVRMWWSFYWINYLLRREVSLRDYYPLGDEAWTGEYIKVRERPEPLPFALRPQAVALECT